jgi:hypothetical protein
LEGPLHAGLSSTTQSTLLQLEEQVRCLVGDRPLVPEAALDSEQLLLAVSCRVSKLEDLVAPSIANGGFLAVMQHALGSISASPGDYARWADVTTAEYRSVGQQLAGEGVQGRPVR